MSPYDNRLQDDNSPQGTDNLRSVEAALAQPGRGMGAPEAQKTQAPTDAFAAPSLSPFTPEGVAALGVPMPSSNSSFAPRTKAETGKFAERYRNALGVLRSAVDGVRNGDMGVDGIRQLASKTVQQLVGGLGGATQQPGAAKSQFDMPSAEPPKVTMLAPQGGGKPLAGYEYNGNRVLLGDGIDVNDAAAVQKYMTETNDLIDMMNSAYEED